MILKAKEQVEQKETIFKPISQMLDNVLKDSEYRANKKNLYFSEHRTNEYIEIGKNIGYDFGIDPYGGQFQNSSIAIECSNIECLMHGDLVTKEQNTVDELVEMFNEPTCAVTDIHGHDDEKHVHILCLGHYKNIEEKARNLNKLLIR